MNGHDLTRSKAWHLLCCKHPVADRKPDGIEAGGVEKLEVRLCDPNLSMLLDRRPYDVRQRLVCGKLRMSMYAYHVRTSGGGESRNDSRP